MCLNLINCKKMGSKSSEGLQDFNEDLIYGSSKIIWNSMKLTEVMSLFRPAPFTQHSVCVCPTGLILDLGLYFKMQNIPST